MFDYGREELESEYNARFDYYSEAYGAEARLMDAQNMAEWEEFQREEAERFEVDFAAGRVQFGPCREDGAHPPVCFCDDCIPF